MNGCLRISRRTGFGFVETVFSILLVGGVLVAALNSVGAATTGRNHAESRARGQLLAESLMAEILAQAYQDESMLGTMGLESGEADVNRMKFDDVDDYRNYTDSPPSLRDGTLIEGFSHWTRTVSVVRADATSLNSIAMTDSGLKRIRITVKCNKVTVASLVGFKTSTDPIAGRSRNLLIEVLDLVLTPL